jgi:ferrous iron transport protein B
MGTIILGASILVWFLSYYPNHNAYQTIAEQQENSYLGKIGKTIEPVLAPCGFDWKQDVSIIAGAAAKEIVASTVAVLYSGEDAEAAVGEKDHAVSSDTHLQQVLRKNLTPLRAFSFMIFVLLYMPCLPGVVAIHGETNRWKWSAFVVGYTIVLAWIVSTCVFQVGSLIL